MKRYKRNRKRYILVAEPRTAGEAIWYFCGGDEKWTHNRNKAKRFSNEDEVLKHTEPAARSHFLFKAEKVR